MPPAVLASAVDWALAYARRGWHVLPVGADKKPLDGHGLASATTNPVTIIAWFMCRPDAGVAIACKASGLVVVDLDRGHEPGIDGVATLQALAGTEPFGAALVARTPSGGRHLFFSAPPGEGIRSRNGIRPGIDVKGGGGEHGGYVVVPSGGAGREWKEGDPFDVQLSPPPAWLLEILRDDPRRSTARPPSPPPSPPRADFSLTEVRSALYAIPPEIGREMWLQVIYAVHAAWGGSADGAQLVEQWSSLSTKTNGDGKPQYVPGEATDIYRKALPPQYLPNRQAVDKGTLFALAREHGWRAAGSRCAGPAESAAASPDGESPPTPDAAGVLDVQRTLPTAQRFVEQHYTHADGHRLLHVHAGVLWHWSGNCYIELKDEQLRHLLQPWLDGAHVKKTVGGQVETRPFPANTRTIAATVDAVRDYVLLPEGIQPTAWLGKDAPPAPLHELLPGRTQTLHVPTGKLFVPTPLLFCTSALDFDYDPIAPEPIRWLAFMRELFGEDTESIEALQEWFAYCLTANTRLQKALLIVGPRRSGKGTIGRILTRLVGAANSCGPTVASLAGPFGLQHLVGKSLALVSDARFTGEHIGKVVELLLCITGEDAIAIDRKYLPSVTVKLPTRFVFLTNELPRMADSATALAGRFLVLRLTESFYDKEDHGLDDALAAELPGILKWALVGWKRLHERGRFLEPTSSREAKEQLEDLASPVSAFVRDRCNVVPGKRVYCDALYQAWQRWCVDDGRINATTKTTFGRDLGAACPGVARRRGSDNIGFYVGIELKP